MYGCNAFDKKRPTSQPMSFWTEQDVLLYLLVNKVKYASVYGKIKCFYHGKEVAYRFAQKDVLKNTQIRLSNFVFLFLE